MQVWVKNIKNEDAINAFLTGPDFKLVPIKKTGNAGFDDLPQIDDKRCKVKVTPKMKMFPVHAGEPLVVNMAQSAGVISLVRVNQLSVTMGNGPQPEPEAPKGEKEERIEVAKDAVFQLYAPICVYYSDAEGASYGSCRTYRLSVVGGRFPNDPHNFSCPDTPVAGIFEETFANYCED